MEGNGNTASARRFPSRVAVQVTQEEKLAVRFVATVRDITDSEVMRLFTASTVVEEYRRVAEALGLQDDEVEARLMPQKEETPAQDG